MTDTTSNATISTTTDNKPNVVVLKERFDSLIERANAAAPVLEGAVPLTGRPAAVQEAFMFAMADFKLLRYIAGETQKTFNGINLTALTSEQKANADFLDSSLAEILSDMLDNAVEAYGVEKHVILATVVKDLARDIELLESTVARLEAEVALIAA